MLKRFCELSGREIDEFYTLSVVMHSTRHPERDNKPAMKPLEISPWEFEELKKFLDERKVEE